MKKTNEWKKNAVKTLGINLKELEKRTTKWEEKRKLKKEFRKLIIKTGKNFNSVDFFIKKLKERYGITDEGAKEKLRKIAKELFPKKEKLA